MRKFQKKPLNDGELLALAISGVVICGVLSWTLAYLIVG